MRCSWISCSRWHRSEWWAGRGKREREKERVPGREDKWQGGGQEDSRGARRWGGQTAWRWWAGSGPHLLPGCTSKWVWLLGRREHVGHPERWQAWLVQAYTAQGPDRLHADQGSHRAAISLACPWHKRFACDLHVTCLPVAAGGSWVGVCPSIGTRTRCGGTSQVGGTSQEGSTAQVGGMVPHRWAVPYRWVAGCRHKTHLGAGTDPGRRQAQVPPGAGTSTQMRQDLSAHRASPAVGLGFCLRQRATCLVALRAAGPVGRAPLAGKLPHRVCTLVHLP